ncbi:MAG: hypothetical protein AAF433_09150 [Bacteroidota bacterium]
MGGVPPPAADGDIRFALPSGRNYFEPLEEIKLSIHQPAATKIIITDGQGRTYQQMDYAENLSFLVGGALGAHRIQLLDRQGRPLTDQLFWVNTRSILEDDSGYWTDFFAILYGTLFGSNYSGGKVVRYNGKYYRFYSSWFQDHVFVAEAMKYFLPDIQSGIDLYADGQRADGLIWDNYKHPYPQLHSFWEYRFNYGGFTYRPEDEHSSAIFVRIPVENIGEHTFIEGLYYAWKATGDTAWMTSRLEQALKAVRFATSSPWYWNEEQQLLKRPFSIDRWDFQSNLDAQITGKDFMGADLDKTRYGIFYGDNICLANACIWLSEMLREVNRSAEATQIEQLGQDLKQRIDQLAWNGQFYEHWIPVENQQNLDFGVDTRQQVTLSNAMALLRGLTTEQAQAIIATYQRIRTEMPPSSPGEWYLCYPPFEHGWHIPKWEYMNGGVSNIVAGDLALGAFQHGFEAYGLDILERVYQQAKDNGMKLEGAYKGQVASPPVRSFQTLDLQPLAQAALSGEVSGTALPWPGGSKADLSQLPTGLQEFGGVPFEVILPQANEGKSVVVVSGRSPHTERVRLLVGARSQSIYLLHASTAPITAGQLSIIYTDGSRHDRYLHKNEEVGHYWYPTIKPAKSGIPKAIVAWRGAAQEVKEVGIYAFGFEHPYPEKTIDYLELSNPASTDWLVLAATLSDGPHFFPPPITTSIPDHWAAAHVFKATMEGLVGIVNTGLAFDRVRIRPLWSLTNTESVKACAKYEVSQSYCSYQYRLKEDQNCELTFTSTAAFFSLELLLPSATSIANLQLNGQAVKHEQRRQGESIYACLEVQGVGVNRLNWQLN